MRTIAGLILGFFVGWLVFGSTPPEVTTFMEYLQETGKDAVQTAASAIGFD